MTRTTDNADASVTIGTLLHLLAEERPSPSGPPYVHRISFAEPDPTDDPDFWRHPPSFTIVEYPSQFTPPSGSPLVGKAR